MPKIHDIEVEQFLYDSIRIEPVALQEEYVRMPADLAYWNARFASAYERFATTKVQLSRLEALKRIEHRERLLADTPKVTESMVEAAVAGDPSVQEIQDDLIAAEVDKVRMNGVVDAVRTKRDMLVSVGAHVRAEMQHDPMVRNQSRDANAYPSRNG